MESGSTRLEKLIQTPFIEMLDKKTAESHEINDTCTSHNAKFIELHSSPTTAVSNEIRTNGIEEAQWNIISLHDYPHS